MLEVRGEADWIEENLSTSLGGARNKIGEFEALPGNLLSNSTRGLLEVCLSTEKLERVSFALCVLRNVHCVNK